MVKIFLKSHLHKPKDQQAKSYSEATLFPILPLEKLLPDIEKNHYLQKIKEIVLISDEYFNIIYADLIDNFALFVQTLPEFYGEELGGLLSDGLRRALLAIQILTDKPEAKPHPLFVFAVFSLALLSDLGQVIGSYRVMISDEKGAFIDDWYPLLGNMSEFGDYFKLRPYEGTSQSLIHNITPLLARQLLTDTGLTWLSSNNQIFDMWLAFLQKGEDWAGGLGKILKIDRKQFELMKKHELDSLTLDIHPQEALDTEMGEKFWEWLKTALADGTVTYNESDSKVHVVHYSELELSIFLQAPELFRQFCNLYPRYRDWVAACKQFNALGLTRLKEGNELKLEQFFSDNPEGKPSRLGFLGREKTAKQKSSHGEQGLLSSSMVTTSKNVVQGVVVKDARLLFGAKVPGASPYLQSIEMRWGLENVLPKIRNAPQMQGPGIKMKPE